MKRRETAGSPGVFMLSALLVLSLAGCGTTWQLSTFKKDERAQKYASIANATIDSGCTGGTPTDACSQLWEIQGRACLTLARQEAAPNAACPPATDTARRHLQCAATDLDASRIAQGLPPDQLADITEMHARALYCGATLKARSDGLPDAREAATELESSALPADAKRDQLAAAAELYVANSEQLPNADRCAAAQRAVARTDHGLQNNPSADIQQGLMATREHAVSVAAHLSGCPTSQP